MEAQNLQIIHNFVKTPSLAVDHPKTIKMEDLTSTCPSTPDTSFLDPSAETPRSVESKPVKKRKSWGQVLPEPKTALPPRKRAKTADEKEQRRIERVKRNRLAAHNSRERKRQEVELLQIRNAKLEQRLRAMESQLDTFRTLYPQADVPVLPKMEFKMELPLDSFQDGSEFNTDAPSSQAPFESPDSLLSTLDSPVDTAPSTPGTEMMEDGAEPTQHSAVSVGFHPFHLLDGNTNPGKLSLGAELHHSVQFPDPHDEGGVDTFFDFALFPDSTQQFAGSDSFFDESFDGSASHGAQSGGNNPGDALEQLDGSLFDLQPGAGATLAVSDAPGLAAESAHH